MGNLVRSVDHDVKVAVILRVYVGVNADHWVRLETLRFLANKNPLAPSAKFTGRYAAPAKHTSTQTKPATQQQGQ